MRNRIASFAAWVNEKIVGNPITLIVCILFVIVLFVLIPIQGYGKWNITTGLFTNTLESSFELITGVAAVVAVVALHKKHKETDRRLDRMDEEHGKALHRIETHVKRYVK